MKLFQTTISIFVVLIVAFALSKNFGFDRFIDDGLTFLSRPLLTVRTTIVDAADKTGDFFQTEEPLEILQEKLKNLETEFPYPLPAKIAFYSHVKNDITILRAKSLAGKETPVFSLETGTMFGIVKDSANEFIAVERLQFMTRKFPATTSHNAGTVDGVVYSAGGRVYFSTFDPVDLDPGDVVTITSSTPSFGYFKELGLEKIGTIAGRVEKDYILAIPEDFGSYFLYME